MSGSWRSLVGSDYQVRIVPSRQTCLGATTTPSTMLSVSCGRRRYRPDNIRAPRRPLFRRDVGFSGARQSHPWRRRHDERVLDVLRLHQAEHFGAKILGPFRPPNAAPRRPGACARPRRACVHESRTQGAAQETRKPGGTERTTDDRAHECRIGWCALSPGSAWEAAQDSVIVRFALH
jgi:hypothetical protein